MAAVEAVAAVGLTSPVDEEDTKEIDNKKLYEILEVDPKASDAEIRKNFKRLTLKYHPDREGGNEEKFKEVNLAYEVRTTLLDPQRQR